MFEPSTHEGVQQDVTAAGAGLDAAAVAGWIQGLGSLDRHVSDAQRVDQIRLLEELKAAAAAAQARVSVDFDLSQRFGQVAAGLPSEQVGRGIASQVALARRESPHRGGRHLGLAKAIVNEMPHTLAAMSSGRLSEWRATLLVRETACLTAADRRHIDAELMAEPDRVAGLGDRGLVAEVKKVAYRLDPVSVVQRNRRAEADRHVTCRPAPDTMAYLSALLPVSEAVAAYSALVKAADSARGAGDPRGHGQIMADTLVERVTGQAAAPSVPVEVQLVVTDTTLFSGDDEPAHLHGYGPIPAGHARDLVADLPEDVTAWVRRLYAEPDTGELVAMDSHRRLFEHALRRLLVIRDQTCRTPWCDAPIRHADHLVPHHAGGPTAAENGQGLCQTCNHAKQAPGWRASPGPRLPGRRHSVKTMTPTGHAYLSTAPPLPGVRPPPQPSRLEAHFTNLILTA